eukprot:15323434-Alexandrium_andersonii.AAC.1
MSASLVGSEMCIRDRLLVMCALFLAQQTRALAPARLPARASRRTCDLVAVSYTHLTLPTICSV